MDPIQARIDEIVKAHPVVLFMKGSKTAPQCGFSGRVASILSYIGVDYFDVNVLEDAEIREAIKAYSDWPTIPQLYIKGQFIGGADIVTEMTLSAELDTVFEKNDVPFEKEAAEKIREQNHN